MEKATNRSTPRTQPGLRILFADDDAAMGWLVSRYLENVGHQVHVVDNGQLALELVQKETFDVVLLDLLMPEMDGIETAVKIRAYSEDAGLSFPIIAATSHRVESLDIRWDENVFDAVLAKPVKGEELAQVIADLAS